MVLPEQFVYLKAIDPTILQDIKYATTDNFMGRIVTGYEAEECILTLPAACALSNIQAQLKLKNLSLKVFDGYRPQMAVDDFVAWSEDPSDIKMKADFYPNLDKPDLFKQHYLSAKSTHTRGSTVDLTIAELDMGSAFDLLDELSHTFTDKVSDVAKRNRLMLRELMHEAGFQGVPNEWWHFTYRDEPYPDTYFNFKVQR